MTYAARSTVQPAPGLPTDGSPTLEATVERIHADHATVKRLGNWTTADRFEIRARSAMVVVDLRSPRLPDEVTVHVEATRAVVRLLLPQGAEADHWDLRWTARGRVKDAQGQLASTDGHADPGPRRVRLTGVAHNAEVRVTRGGVAQLAAMFSRAYVDDVRRAHRTGGFPTVDDPARTGVPAGRSRKVTAN